MKSSSQAAPGAERMQCMEVWGGNEAINQCVEMTGLNVWVNCQPYRGAKQGGDVYYLSACASGRIARLMLADVSGHGQQVSPIAADLRGLMRRYVNYISQQKFVEKLNTRFEPLAALGQFATGIAFTFFGPTRMLTICNFGHPMPLIYRANQGEWVQLEKEVRTEQEPRNLPLGIVENRSIRQCETQLREGDAVFCFTDGVSEAQTSDGELLGSEGVYQLVREFPMNDPAQLIPWLQERLQQMHADNLNRDDMTSMLFQANGTSPSWKDNLLAPFRLLSPKQSQGN